ncbi:MAG: hypothetical protein D4S01_01750 [Dehalococcoidia bacterium]|nr:MAG: hypothetical protein D4S01_01750 [Dehalococcoidia bacterium]
MAQIDLKQATVTIKDGAGHSLEVRIGEGNLTYTEAKTMEYKLNRGLLDEVREGDQVPIAVAFDFVWDYLKGPSSASGSGGTPTIEDALKKRGAAAAWTSSDSDECRPYAVDLVILYTPDCSTGDKEEITLPDYRFESLAHDVGAGTVASSGNCNATDAIVVRSAQ